MKKLWCLLLCLALLLSATALAIDATGEAVQPYAAGNTLSSASRSHSYDDCIVDGGIYHLRNKSTGQYMNVSNAADGSVVSTAAYTGSTNQKFKMVYMGKGIYEIVSVFSGTRLHIGSENELTVRTQNRGAEQKFRLHLVWSCTAVVYSQYGDATGALTWGASSSGTITRQNYPTLSDQTKGQWVFERAGTDIYESYATFYIRNVSKNLYLDVHNEVTTDGMVVHGYSGLAQANQEWKMVSCPEGGYYLKSSIKRDMALDYRGNYLTIYPDNNVSTQQIFLYWVDYDVESGSDLFRIGVNTATGIQYLTMKTQPDYATVHYYAEWSADATDLWVFERVVVDAKDPRPLSLSTSATDLVSSTITAGYNESKYYTFCPTKTSRYKIEFVTSYTCIFEDLISQAGDACERDRYIYRDTLIVDVFMQEGVVYYLPIKFAGTAGGADGTFTIRIRQLNLRGA